MSTTLDADIRHLMFKKDYFYGFFLMQLNRRIESDHTKCPTAAIEIKESGATLVINPQFWAAHNLDERLAFLKHEVGHFILGHIPLGRELMTKWNQQLFNTAADLAVNSLIPEFPDKVTAPWGPDGAMTEGETCTIRNFKKTYPKIESGKSFFWYMEFLQLNDFAKQPQDGDGDSSGQEGGDQSGTFKDGQFKFDDHSKWGSKIPKEVADQIAKQLVRNAVNETETIGSLDGLAPELRDLLKQLLKQHNGWKRELRRFPQDAEAISLESTRKRINKRFGTTYPGHKKERKTQGIVGFDVSGSMWDEATVNRVMNEVKTIAQDADVTILFFDTGITKEVAFEEGLSFKQIPGGGGTLFQPVLDRAKTLKADWLIMLTDGMNADEMEKPRFPVLWGILEEYDYSAPFGKVIKIPKAEENVG